VLILITTVPTSDFVFLSESQIDDSSFGLSPFTENIFIRRLIGHSSLTKSQRSQILRNMSYNCDNF